VTRTETIIRPSTPADHPSIAALLDRTMGPRPYAQRLQLWEWRFERNPARTDAFPSFLVLEKDGHIAGVHGLTPLRLKAGEDHLHASCSCDLAVDPTARSAGMKLKLKTLSRELSSFHFSTSANESANRITLALGGKEVPIARRSYIKPFKASGLLRRRWEKGGGGAGMGAFAGTVVGKPIDWGLATSRMVRPRRRMEGSTIRNVTRFDERFDMFWERLAMEQVILIVRDSSYLNWRYASYPFAGVQSFELSGGEELLGYSVIHISVDEDRLRFAALLELAGPDREDLLLEQLLEEAVGRAIRGGAHYMIARATTPRCGELLLRHGFRARDLHFSPVTYRNNSGIPDELFARDWNWYVTLGDGDGCYFFD